jgi:cobalamin synthase
MISEFDKQKLYESYATALSKAWESYIKIIDLLLGLAGATALVFVASIKITDWASLPNKSFIVYVFIFSAMAMICGACWRFASQHFMEYETLGSNYAANHYFDVSGIVPVTTIHQAKSSLRNFYRFCFQVFPIPMGIFLLGAWISIFLVFFSGTPIVPKLTDTTAIKRNAPQAVHPTR